MTASDASEVTGQAFRTIGAASPTRDIFVVGASAGAVPSLRALFGALPADFGGSVFVVVHISPDAGSELPAILDRAGPLPAVSPADREPIAPRRIYVAPPDRHMLLEGGHVRIVRGPKENRHRPAIDPLFRSAAWAFGPRVVGVVLTGYLDDGAAGLWAIKSCGGTTVVQSPGDALHPDMPQNALLLNRVDHVVRLDEMPALFAELARTRAPADRDYAGPVGLQTEVSFATLDRDIDDMDALGRLSAFTCPACRGALWELDEGGLLRYRCHTGHAFTSDSLVAEQSSSIEEGLYSALRAVEEKATILRRLSQQLRSQHSKISADYQGKAREMDRAADVLRELLTRG